MRQLPGAQHTIRARSPGCHAIFINKYGLRIVNNKLPPLGLKVENVPTTACLLLQTWWCDNATRKIAMHTSSFSAILWSITVSRALCDITFQLIAKPSTFDLIQQIRITRIFWPLYSWKHVLLFVPWWPLRSFTLRLASFARITSRFRHRATTGLLCIFLSHSTCHLCKLVSST